MVAARSCALDLMIYTRSQGMRLIAHNHSGIPWPNRLAMAARAMRTSRADEAYARSWPMCLIAFTFDRWV